MLAFGIGERFDIAISMDVYWLTPMVRQLAYESGVLPSITSCSDNVVPESSSDWAFHCLIEELHYPSSETH